MVRPLVNYVNSSDEWYTPGSVVQEVLNRLALRQVDLDVASPAIRTLPARRRFTRKQDGLSQPGSGVVWCNPPYSQTMEWCRKVVGEAETGWIIAVIGFLSASLYAGWFHYHVLPVMFCIRRHQAYIEWPDGAERRKTEASVLVL
ncbi:DNA N-6-adenine-methyltransferase [Azospirillum rugosum]|nr:DNA N-6-adenine-methyltransferase [Azospirillum rugosum]MBP2296601.1 hypothetical protein [Azospirillum rugosum]MDQ0530340.1 hypothetical protein [Azospirillum rugosum]